MNKIHNLIRLSLVLIITPFSGIIFAAEDYYPGFTLVAAGSSIKLYNDDNEVEKSWSTSSSVETAAYLLPDGSVIAPIRGTNGFNGHGGHPHGRIQKFDWNGNLTWDFSYATSSYVGAYDIEPMPNGNVLLIVHYNEGGGMSGAPGRLVEIEPSGTSDGNVVWECNVTSLINVSGYLNSVCYNPTLDQFAVTIQESGRTVAVIDRSTKSVVSSYSASYGRIHGCAWSMDTYIGTDIKISDADTSSMILGNITFVANGLGEVNEITPLPPTATLFNNLNFSFGSHQGGTQPLPNGNTLVTTGYSSNIEEIDENGNSVWSLTASGQAMRVYKYGYNYPGVSELVPTANVSNNIFFSNQEISILKKSNNIIVTLPENSQPKEINILNFKGKKILSSQINNYKSIIKTDRLSKGTYIIQAKLANSIASKKIQISK